MRANSKAKVWEGWHRAASKKGLYSAHAGFHQIDKPGALRAKMKIKNDVTPWIRAGIVPQPFDFRRNMTVRALPRDPGEGGGQDQNLKPP